MNRIIEEDNAKSRIRKLISKLLFATFFVLIILSLPALCQGHGHEHDEPPGFKYSNEAQQLHSEKPHIHNHDHQTTQHKHEAGHRHVLNEESVLPERSYFNTVLSAVGSTLFISAAPFFILFLLPIDNTKEREPQLKILLSFASGGLLGDAFLHLIPHALVPHSHASHGHVDTESHSHSHTENRVEEEHDHSHNMSVGICILLGIVVFLMVEKMVRIIKSDHGHHHSHTVSKNTMDNKKNNDSKEQQDKNKSSSKTTVIENPTSDIKITGYMNLAADFLHNFTDGLAIGASYLVNDNVGYITTFTIFCHEIPHEIGDFAILIQSGYSARKAMLLQLTTAVGALLGTYVSFVAEGMGDFATMWILPFTAGGFIYIATVSIIPDLLTDTKFWQSVKEIIALVVGVGMMVIIAKYE